MGNVCLCVEKSRKERFMIQFRILRCRTWWLQPSQKKYVYSILYKPMLIFLCFIHAFRPDFITPFIQLSIWFIRSWLIVFFPLFTQVNETKRPQNAKLPFRNLIQFICMSYIGLLKTTLNLFNQLSTDLSYFKIHENLRNKFSLISKLCVFASFADLIRWQREASGRADERECVG